MIQTRNNAWRCAITLAVAGMTTIPGVAYAASVSEVMAKFIEATGGQAAQEGVTSAIQRVKFDIPEIGVQTTGINYYKDGNLRSVMKIPGVGEMILGVTDGVAWTMNPLEGNSILKGQAAEAARERALFNPLLAWKENYTTAEIVGEEAGATKIKFTSASGRETTCYFNNDSGLLTKQELVGINGSPQTVRFSEYNRLGPSGEMITLPYKLHIETPAASTVMTYYGVELNPEIDDGMFDLPSEIGDDLAKYFPMSTLTKQDQATEVEKANRKQTAASPPAPGEFTAENIMEFLDANGDGKITMDEAPEEVKTGFSFIDTNGDGGIDLKEAQIMADYANNEQSQPFEEPATGEVTAEQLMSLMDANGDGKITMDEASADLKPFFAQVDQNGDGGIDVKEAQVIANYANNEQ